MGEAGRGRWGRPGGESPREPLCAQPGHMAEGRPGGQRGSRQQGSPPAQTARQGRSHILGVTEFDLSWGLCPDLVQPLHPRPVPSQTHSPWPPGWAQPPGGRARWPGAQRVRTPRRGLSLSWDPQPSPGFPVSSVSPCWLASCLVTRYGGQTQFRNFAGNLQILRHLNLLTCLCLCFCTFSFHFSF